MRLCLDTKSSGLDHASAFRTALSYEGLTSEASRFGSLGTAKYCSWTVALVSWSSTAFNHLHKFTHRLTYPVQLRFARFEHGPFPACQLCNASPKKSLRFLLSCFLNLDFLLLLLVHCPAIALSAVALASSLEGCFASFLVIIP